MPRTSAPAPEEPHKPRPAVLPPRPVQQTTASPRRLPMPPVKPAKAVVPRLPPGSSKLHEWNGHEWTGIMIVLGQSFKAQDKNEQKNLWSLDRLYRAWLKEQSAEVKAKHMEHLK